MTERARLAAAFSAWFWEAQMRFGNVRNRVLQSAVMLSALAVCALQTLDAESFPAAKHPIRIVVPTGPGSPPDVISRIIATELADSEGWTMIVENRPGALQTIGMADVLKAPADGHSIFPMSLGAMATPTLLPDKGLRLDADFAPVIKVAIGYNALVVNASVSARSLADLVALLKAHPDQYNFASGGFGTPAHLIGELFKLQTGVRATHVPYQQGQQRMVDLLNGSIQFDFITSVRAVDLIRSGKLRALAVMAPTRVAALNDVPTVIEQGFPDLVVEDFTGWAVKNGTPNETVARLNAAMNKVLTNRKVQDPFARIGYEAAGGTPTEFGIFLKSQLDQWRRVVKESGIKMPQ